MESWNGPFPGWGHSHAEIYVDDDICAESDIGNIPKGVVEGWESRCGSLFGADSTNAIKTELDGRWYARGSVQCFDVDTAEGTIAAPSPKIEGSRIFVMSEEFAVGSQHIALAALQTLRGYMQHWLVASMFWANCVQPVGLLMAYSSEDGTTINCPNCQIWSGFRDMLSLLQSLANDTVAWLTSFRNKLVRTVALHRRFLCPRIADEVRLITTDSTPSLISAVDWEIERISEFRQWELWNLSWKTPGNWQASQIKNRWVCR